tara:strand:+ start:530 stop:1381 length:852 start_codon:yes stop_codon:yes gene_type:complete
MASLLDEALKSVISQSYDNWELIIIDNHSIDNTDEILKKYTDNRIKILKINNNGIIAKSRNAGLAKASGDWIAFLDSDDIWYPQRLEILISAIDKKNNIDVISTNELLVNKNTGYTKKLIYGKKSIDNLYLSLLIYGNILSPSATLVKRSFINKNYINFSENINFITAEDYDFWLLLAKYNAALISLNTIQGEYRVHNNNNSINNSLHKDNVKNVIFNHIEKLNINEKSRKKIINKVNSRLMLSDAKINLISKNYIRGILLIFGSLKKSPLFFIKNGILKIFK